MIHDEKGTRFTARTKMATRSPVASVVFGVALVLGAGGSLHGQPREAQSQWVHPGPSGRLVYKTTPAGDRIMDFSSAGYMGGGVALPIVPVKLTVQPSGGPDDTTAIQDAINKVAAMPLEGNFRGAVLLAPGTFTCSRALTIGASGVVLRGSGSGSDGGAASTIMMTGTRHVAIGIGGGRGRRQNDNPAVDDESPAQGDADTGRQTPCPACL